MADLEEAVIEKGTEVITFLREECRIPPEQCEALEALITNAEEAKGWSPDGRSQHSVSEAFMNAPFT
jgi:hypothetical protein